MGILTEFAKDYARIKVVGLPNPREKGWYYGLADFVNNNPNSIFIVCCSSEPFVYTQDQYLKEVFNQ